MRIHDFVTERGDAPQGRIENTKNNYDKDLIKAVEFVRSIGIPVHEKPGATGFLSNIEIVSGQLMADFSTCLVSDFLHEAGHLAITPSRYRSWMNDDLAVGQKAMLDDVHAQLERTGDIDCELYRAAIQTSDVEATAWAWAAGKHLGISDEKIILDTDYNGDGRDIRVLLAARQYLGINGLAHAGFCAASQIMAEYLWLPLYPKLLRWVQV